jgi:hypothetical protein
VTDAALPDEGRHQASHASGGARGDYRGCSDVLGLGLPDWGVSVAAIVAQIRGPPVNGICAAALARFIGIGAYDRQFDQTTEDEARVVPASA